MNWCHDMTEYVLVSKLFVAKNRKPCQLWRKFTEYWSGKVDIRVRKYKFNIFWTTNVKNILKLFDTHFFYFVHDIFSLGREVQLARIHILFFYFKKLILIFLCSTNKKNWVLQSFKFHNDEDRTFELYSLIYHMYFEIKGMFYFQFSGFFLVFIQSLMFLNFQVYFQVLEPNLFN